MSMIPKDIVLLDRYYRGHHRSYIEMLCRYWVSTQQPGSLRVLVTKEFSQTHPDLKNWIEGQSAQGLRYNELSISSATQSTATGLRSLLATDEAHKQAIVEAAAFKPDHIVCMMLDHAQLAARSLDSFLKTRSITISGILFRATTHEPAFGWKAHLSKVRKRLILKRCVSGAQFKTLFTLDPEAVPAINELAGRNVCQWLPDGTTFADSSEPLETVKNELGLADTDQIVLLFGALSERKGIFQALEAMSTVQNSENKGAVLLIVGKPEPAEKQTIEAQINQARQRINLVYHPHFVSEARMLTLFRMADVVLAPYQDHIGSSGILIRAAEAGKPVVGSNSGMVGRNIVTYGLGLAVDTSDPTQLASSIIQLLSQPNGFQSRPTMKEFAEENTADRFAQVVFNSITN